MKPVFKVCPRLENEDLNLLFSSAWPAHVATDFQPLLGHALTFVGAFEGERLIGFAKVVSDGGVHGFLLDPTVVPDWQKHGIGKRLVMICAEEARRLGVEWLHVDYEPTLKSFYDACGFRPTHAGLWNVKKEAPTPQP